MPGAFGSHLATSPPFRWRLAAIAVCASLAGCQAKVGDEPARTTRTPQRFVPIPGAPYVLSTDIVAGSLTGGESNLGAYVSLFGHGFGYASRGAAAQAALGTASGARVWFRNPAGDDVWHEVANYRALIPSRVYANLWVEQLIVQLGSLGGQPAGAALDVKVTVDGVDSNVLDGWFTVQPGRFFFASLGGNDSTGVVDDITHPFRYVQRYSGGGYAGIWDTTVPTGAAGLRAGDTIVIRGGTWSDTFSHDGQWVRFYSHNGSPPNGAVGHGYLNFVRYPGPILGHAPEDVLWQDPGTANGGINGPESSRWHLCGQYVTISGLRLASGATNLSGPIDLQAGGDSWRIFDTDLTFPTNQHATNGGIAGTGHDDTIWFNFIHDIGGDANYETHGIYIGDASLSSGADISQGWDIGYNWLRGINYGSCIQWNATMSSAPFVGMQIHHNWIEHCAKNGLNASNNTGAGHAWYGNVILDVQGAEAGASLMVKDYQPGMGLDILHNTVVQYTSGSDGSIISTQGSGFSSGAVNVLHNIFAMGPGHGTALTAFDGLGGNGSAIRISQNLWFNFGPSGPTAKPPSDGAGIYADPQFVGPPTSRLSDDGVYVLQAGSPARNACTTAETIAIPMDLLGVPLPVPDTGAPGASRNDLGAFEYDSGS